MEIMVGEYDDRQAGMDRAVAESSHLIPNIPMYRHKSLLSTSAPMQKPSLDVIPLLGSQRVEDP